MKASNSKIFTVERVNVLGSEISAITIAGAIKTLIEMSKMEVGGYVCFANVHSVVTARGDRALRDSINGSRFTMPDGQPIYWLVKCMTKGSCSHIPGPEFFRLFMEAGISVGAKHYFIGGKPEVLDRLVGNMKARFKDLLVVGSESPPFRQMTEIEINGMLSRIRESGANFVWVGLGAPKQELWMARYASRLNPALLFGVGAAFDFHAGVVNRAPPLISTFGFEWLYRLIQEPRRLWRRYLVTNSKFIFLVILEYVLQIRIKLR